MSAPCTSSWNRYDHPRPRQAHTSAQLDGDSEGIFQLSLTRPDAKNAIGRQFLSELTEALTNVTREQSTRCLVVRSTVDGVFCAGADLKERAGMTQQETHEFVSALRATFKQLEVR